MQSASELELVGERNELYITLRESLLSDRRFTLGEKLFIARISGFKTYVESNEHCAEFLGVGVNTIKRAKAKLIELGALEEISFDGKKKTFAVKLAQLFNDELAQNNASSKRANSQLKMSQQLAQNEPHIIKDKEKVKEKKNIDSKESILAQEPNCELAKEDSFKDEKQTEFGNANINEAFAQWQDATGYDFKSNQYERRAMFNLLRRKDIQAFGGFKLLVSLVKEANRISNQFAPKVIKPSELGGKYSKFEKLVEWSKRSKNESTHTTDAKGNKFTRPLTECEDALIRSYFKPCPYVQSFEADDGGPTNEDIEKTVASKQESKWDSSAPDFYQKMREIAFGKSSKQKGDSNEAK